MYTYYKYVWAIVLLLTTCANDEPSLSKTSSFADRLPHPIEVPNMKIQGYTERNVTLEISREWPREDSPPDFYYAEPPIAWPDPIKMDGSLEVIWTTSIEPIAVNIWIYKRRDIDGIPIGNSIANYECSSRTRYDELLLCDFYHYNKKVHLKTDLFPHTYQAQIIVIQAERLTLEIENSRSARASWVLVLEHHNNP